MKEKFIFLNLMLTLCVFVGIKSYAQDATFVQNFSNPLSLNPAFAGSLGCSRMALQYRNMMPSITNDYFLFSSSYDQYVDKLQGGAGLQFSSENSPSGIITTNSINGFYAYDLNINENFHIRPAFNIGMGIQKIDWSKLSFQPPAGSTSSKTYFNAGAGLLVVYKSLISGISFDHINRPILAVGTYKLPVKFGLHSSCLFDIKENTHVTPGVIFRKQQDIEEVVLNILLQFKYIKFGFGYSQVFKLKESILGTVGFCNDRMSIGYSFDVFLSKLSTASLGSHEVSAVFKISCRNDKEKFKITQLCGF